MSLLNYTNESATLPSYAFSQLFKVTQIHDAHELILPDHASEYCYWNMFIGCTSLTTAPDLPATALAEGCYWSMFYNCASLTTAPTLPATTLVADCYNCMFRDCTSLTQAPELPATTLETSCY